MNEDDCCTAGGKLPKHMTFPMAWEVDRSKVDRKASHLLKLFGIHLLDLSEKNKDRFIKLFNEILGIKEIIREGNLYVLEFAEGDKYVVCKAVFHEGKTRLQDVKTGGIISDKPVKYMLLDECFWDSKCFGTA